jgi:hypothetical protein
VCVLEGGVNDESKAIAGHLYARQLTHATPGWLAGCEIPSIWIRPLLSYGCDLTIEGNPARGDNEQDDENPKFGWSFEGFNF